MAITRSVFGMFSFHCLQILKNVIGIHVLVCIVVYGSCGKRNENDHIKVLNSTCFTAALCDFVGKLR